MGKKHALVVFLLLLIFLGGFLVWKNKNQKAELRVKVGQALVKVEIADNEAKRAKGLSGRKEFCPDCGLLFLFDKPDKYTFWMKEMYFDIDILWISGNKVVDITECARKPSAENFDSPKEIYQPKVPVDKVLEVNCGWAEKNKIRIGDNFKINKGF